MPITYPRSDILELCNLREATFWAMPRQELSRTAGGKTQVKDFGSPLWRAQFTTARMDRRDQAAAFEAAMMSLNGSAGSFLAHDVRYPFPRAHRDGAFADTGTILTLFADDAFQIRLGKLPPGLTLSRGDYLGFRYGANQSHALHRVVSGGGPADALGRVLLTVFPAIRPGAAAGAPVTLKRAPCEMILEPGGSPPAMPDLTTIAATFTAIQIL